MNSLPNSVSSSGAIAQTQKDKIDFADLDPCCVRDLIEKRKASSLRAKLNKFDRSNRRVDTKERVFKSVKSYHTCNQCIAPVDYSLLTQYRQREIIDAASASAVQQSEDESDIDFDDFDDDFVSEREFVMKQNHLRLLESQHQFKIAYGFGEHRAESIVHLQTSIQIGYPVVCHICNELSPLSCHVDLTLEQLAQQYCGTKFRRVDMSSDETR